MNLPGNCRWATKSEQVNNRMTTHKRMCALRDDVKEAA